MSGSDNSTNTTNTTATATTTQHDWEYSKENTAPLECGRSTKSLSKRAFGTSTVEMAQSEEKTKKYERLVRRSEKAMEWLQRQSTKIVTEKKQSLVASSSTSSSSSSSSTTDGDNNNSNNNNNETLNRELLTEEESQSLRQQLVAELGYDPSTSDRDNIDYDPMRFWVLYIKHIRELYPTDTQRQFLLMERCARTFMAQPFLVPSYQNDVRFIRICILYADKTSNPSEVFKLMSKTKVGTKVSLFWVAWAWVAEKAQDFPFTEKIFQKALSVGAEPRQFLEDRQRQFLRRMSRHWLDASHVMQEDGLGDGDDSEDCARKRGVLSSLSSEGVSGNDRGSGLGRHAPPQQPNGPISTRPPSRSSNKPLGGKGNNMPMAGFNIFQDGNTIGNSDVLNDENNPLGGQLRLEKESERGKENNMRPELWNERGYGLVNPSTMTTTASSAIIVESARDSVPRSCSTAAFEVFVDEDLNQLENDKDVTKENSARSTTTDQRSLRHRVDGGAADRLTRDPLRYMKNPSKVMSDHIKYDASQEEQCSDRAKNVKQVANAEDKKNDESDEEHCFEELRLHAHYFTLSSSDVDFNLLKLEDNDQSDSSSRMDVEESIMVDESCSEMDTGDDKKMIKYPIKSVLKSSIKQRIIADLAETKDDELSAMANPHRVLFGANTNVVYTNNASIDTSTASSQFNGSFVKVEETINTKLANAEISMMFSSPNANTSFATTDDDGCLLKGLDFSIYQDDANKSADAEKCEKNSIIYSETNGMSFAIHNDDKNESYVGQVRASGTSGEDTASLSIIGNVFDGLECKEKYAAVGFKRNTDSHSSFKHSTSRTAKDLLWEKRRNELEKASEETADFALFHGIMGSLNNCSVTKPPRSLSLKVAKESLLRPANTESAFVHDVKTSRGASSFSNRLGFEIFSDENTTPEQKRNAVSDLSFGDISRIEDERTSNFQILDEHADAIPLKKCNAIVYKRRHKHDMESAMRECMAEAAVSGSQLTIFDKRMNSMPKALLRQSFTSGTKIVLSGKDAVTISNELGRGVYGVVLLCNNEAGESDALKVQAPIGSLAHEYSILLRMENRIDPTIDFYPFPRSRALYAFSEGGLFSMTAGSVSGMTLIDVVNTYKKITGNVPELLAMYYTSRMLKHLELLHQYGKVLHCDIKPDNWVLTSSSNENAVSRSIGGADLMLVDFGRSIDLSFAASPGSDPLETQFIGLIAAEDMECGSMRDGSSWGIDLDLFGLAASSYILLFGSHMEVVKDRNSGKWRPNKPFRRYWQQELWSSLFDSLLNFDSKSAEECFLHEHSIAFEEYIEGKQRKKDIATHLNQLYTHLPKKR